MPPDDQAEEHAREIKKATVNLRLKASLKEAAEQAAEDDSRSLPSLITKLLKDYLSASGHLAKADERAE